MDIDVKSIEWRDDHLRILDQTFLPSRVIYTAISSTGQVWEAIRNLRIRGATAIGIAAAYGLYLGALDIHDSKFESFRMELQRLCEYLESSRPGIVNLHWSLNRIMSTLQAHKEKEISELKSILLETAKTIHGEDKRNCRAIGEHGVKIVGKNSRIMTHCNTGSLATAGCGTAHSVIRHAHQAGLLKKVWIGETRPLLQGSRLTAWELKKDKIPHTLLTDNAAGYLMQQGKIDMIVVGADRIAANGDTANNVGTYSLAVLASAHDIPFYVAAPCSTIDLCHQTGSHITVEERSSAEITHIGGNLTAPRKSHVYNPAFDITPYRLITGFITEKGIIGPGQFKSLKSAGDLEIV